MEDKRIQKTKKNLKETLLRMLEHKTFEQVTVKELCEKANTSRITFYSHYADKYELADDMLNDMMAQAIGEYQRLQNSNNPGDDPLAGLENMIECMLDIYYVSQHDILERNESKESSYLIFSLYQRVMRAIESCAQRIAHAIKPKYSLRQVTAFLLNGLMGFISECRAQKKPLEEVKALSKSLMRDMFGAMLTLQSGMQSGM